MIIIFRNLSIAILIWMLIFFLHGFFGELYRILKKEYGERQNRKRVLCEANKLVKKELIGWEKMENGGIKITIKKSKDN